MSNLKLTEVRVDIGFTVNVGNYESVKISAAATSKILEPMDIKDTEEILGEVMQEVKNYVIKEVKEIREARA